MCDPWVGVSLLRELAWKALLRGSVSALGVASVAPAARVGFAVSHLYRSECAALLLGWPGVAALPLGGLPSASRAAGPGGHRSAWRS